jgi:CzcA family heavy metal efflux pump
MLNAIIRSALRFRVVTIVLALVLLVYGSYELVHLPIDVFPDLNRPRVTILTEAPGLAPEEVETLITFPLESAVNGATGIEAVRSSSGVGLSVVNAEFSWGTDPYIARQIVTERIAAVSDHMPAGIRPQLAPMSSITGQIVLIGMHSEGNKTSPMEVRTLADWVVRRELLTIPGVAQIITIGGERKQFQVLVNPDELVQYGVTLAEVEQAVKESNGNVGGGYLNESGRELLVRSLGRIETVADLEKIVVKSSPERSVLLRQVATVREGPQTKRGDATVNGSPAVVMVVSKQPGADTRRLTLAISKAIADLQLSLPDDIVLNPNVYQQKGLIDASISNVIHALRDGGILVVIVLFLFLLNFRTTFITLTAIPLSIVMTALVFKWFGMSINTMTLGGLAVAIGELVDDAIVDVENIFRRLHENRELGSPKSSLRVVYEASSEVRNSIVFSTIIVVLVFVPLFALEGMEGRLFAPLGVAYIVSIIASLGVSLTVTPVLSYWLLPRAKFMRRHEDGWLLRQLKRLAGWAIRLSVRHPGPILASVVVLVAISVITATQLGRDFLPPFNEGAVQVNAVVMPGTSLAESTRLAGMVDDRLEKLRADGLVVDFARRTGRGEGDEHAMEVNVSEIIVTLNPESHLSRDEIMAVLREELTQVPGIMIDMEQPLQHLISHMLSGVKASIGIKVYGEELTTLRALGDEMKAAIDGVPGVVDLQVEPQREIPQLQIEINRSQLAQYGLTVEYVNELVETAMNGRAVSEVIQGERKFDLLVRLDDVYREDVDRLKRLALTLPSGGTIPLSDVANIHRGNGPNTINRENVRRRLVVQCNVAERDLAGVVADIEERIAPIRAKLPTGYAIEIGGQFESQQAATRMIGLLSLVSIAGMFLALYTLFRSVNLSLQVLSALPMAAIGAVAALVVTRQSLTVASMVGFISLAGIASRNGILLLAHYLHLVRYEGERFTPEMIERAGKERLAPMLMTALTAGIALVPLVLAAGEPGKEILYPVATVIMGGLISSTLLDFFVHPALFWCFGKAQAERLSDEQQDELGEPIRSTDIQRPNEEMLVS